MFFLNLSENTDFQVVSWNPLSCQFGNILALYFILSRCFGRKELNTTTMLSFYASHAMVITEDLHSESHQFHMAAKQLGFVVNVHLCIHLQQFNNFLRE